MSVVVCGEYVNIGCSAWFNNSNSDWCIVWYNPGAVPSLMSDAAAVVVTSSAWYSVWCSLRCGKRRSVLCGLSCAVAGVVW